MTTFAFVTGRPALDFVATVAERGTIDLDGLATPDDLAAWVRRSGLVENDLTATAIDLRRAATLREALFTLVCALINGTTTPDREREIVNSAAARPGPRLELDAHGQVRRCGDLNAVLAALATDVLDLYGSPDRDVIRWCDDARCTRPFIDRSRGQRRRWCGMQGCGDRAKAAAYRQRQRQRADTQ